MHVFARELRTQGASDTPAQVHTTLYSVSSYTPDVILSNTCVHMHACTWTYKIINVKYPAGGFKQANGW